jgi:hypothetical protein
MTAVDEGNRLCERSDLPREWCGHCKTPGQYEAEFKRENRERERNAEPRARLLGKWFVASHPGRCSRCNTPFRGGDEIRADWPEGAGYIAKACHPNARARRDAA